MTSKFGNASASYFEAVQLGICSSNAVSVKDENSSAAKNQILKLFRYISKSAQRFIKKFWPIFDEISYEATRNSVKQTRPRSFVRKLAKRGLKFFINL